MRNLVRRIKALVVVTVLTTALLAVVRLMIDTAALHGYLVGLSQ